METLNLIKNDPWLEPYADAINCLLYTSDAADD